MSEDRAPERPREVNQQREELSSRVARAIKKLEKRAAAIARDLDEIAKAEALAELARGLMHEAARLPRGSRAIRGTDWTTGEPIEIPIDPAKHPREELERVFSRAKRMRRGAPIAEKRRAEARAAIDELRALDLETDDPELLAALEEKVDRALPREIRAAVPKDRDAPALPYRTFGEERGRILVGRGAARNDELTFHVAKPYHLWMHARGVPGAHVIVPLARGESCPADRLIDAAHLAAHFSDAKGEPLVEIAHAPRKWVRKPRGAPPGLVAIEREKVLVLRLEPERLARLLASER